MSSFLYITNLQAKHTKTEEIVAIKKMQFSGKHTTEVISIVVVIDSMLSICICCCFLFIIMLFLYFTSFLIEMGGHCQRGQVSQSSQTREHYWVQRLLPERFNVLG